MNIIPSRRKQWAQELQDTHLYIERHFKYSEHELKENTASHFITDFQYTRNNRKMLKVKKKKGPIQRNRISTTFNLAISIAQLWRNASRNLLSPINLIRKLLEHMYQQNEGEYRK